MFLQPSKVYNIGNINSLEIEILDNMIFLGLDDQEHIQLHWQKTQELHPDWFDGKIIYGIFHEDNRKLTITTLSFSSYVYMVDHDMIQPDQGMVGFKVFLIDVDDRILIGQRSGSVIQRPGFWTTVGGFFDHTYDDFIQETIYREIKEEIGIDIQSLPIKFHAITYVEKIGIHLIASIQLPVSFDTYQLQSSNEWQGRFEFYRLGELNLLDDRKFTSEFALLEIILD